MTDFIVVVGFIVVGLAVLVLGFRYGKKQEFLEDPPESDDYYAKSNWRKRRDLQEERIAFNEEVRSWARLGACVLLAIGVIGIAINSFTIIPPKSDGVVVVAGKAVTSLPPGAHWVDPWSDIHTLDGTDQIIDQQGEGKCFKVRLANQTIACADVTGLWHVNSDATTSASALWARYRGVDDDQLLGKIGSTLVNGTIRDALNAAFEKYDPLVALAVKEPGNSDTPAVSTTGTELTAQVKADVIAHMDPAITVPSLRIVLVNYDAVTQDKLNKFAQAIGDTRIATQEALTAIQRKLANDNLVQGGNADKPGVMYQNCLNMIAALAASDQLKNLPAGFTCGGQPIGQILGNK